MNDDNPVSVSTRKLRNGKRSYHLRWFDYEVGKQLSRSVGTDKRMAQREATKLRESLADGSFRNIKKSTWDEFVDNVLSVVGGTQSHRGHMRRVLAEFGVVCKPRSPRHVDQSTIYSYRETMKKRGNSPSTLNYKIRYLCRAFKLGIQLKLCTTCPTDGIGEIKFTSKEIRVITLEEEARILHSCGEMYGLKLQAFVKFQLETWGRRSETLSLEWDDVDFAAQSVLFRSTKSHENRWVPIISQDVLSDLRRVQVMTSQDRGPFTAMRNTVPRRFLAVIQSLDIPHVSIHDLRRTGITRALVSGMPTVSVQKMAGHKNIGTTLKYCTIVDRENVRQAREKFYQANAS